MKGLGLGPVLYRPSYLQQGQAGGSLWHVHETSRTLQELCRNSSPPEPTGALGKADPTGPGHPAAGHSGLPQGCVGFTHGADELLAELCVLAVGFCWFVSEHSLSLGIRSCVASCALKVQITRLQEFGKMLI